MERWAWKILCALVSLGVGVVFSLLPFKFINLTKRKRSMKKEDEVKEDEIKEDAVKKDEMKEDEMKVDNTSLYQNAESKEDNPKVEKDKFPKEINLEKVKIIEKQNDEDKEFWFLRVLMCFSGGVFMGTFLLHILPEVNIILSTNLKIHHITYPVSEVLVGAGFFLILFIDLFVAMVREKWNTPKTGARVNNEKAVLVQNDIDVYQSIMNNNNKQPEQTKVSNTTNIPNLQTNTLDKNFQNVTKKSQNVTQTPQNPTKPSPHLPKTTPGHMRAMALVIALSLHHIFEGLAIGLQIEISSLGSLTLAVLLHEVVISFSLGLQFFKQDKILSRLTFTILTTTGSIMPLGIMIGTLLSEVNNGDDDGSSTIQHMLNGVLQALSCGTFIYVTFFEIIFENLLMGKHQTHSTTNADSLNNQLNTQSNPPKSSQIHHHHNHHGVNTTELLRGSLALFLGFVFMALFALIRQHDHSHHFSLHHHHPDR